MNNRSRFRNLLLGGGATVGALAFLIILGAIQYVALQHPKRWDITKGGVYTLAPQSKKVLETFKEKKIPVDVSAFYEMKDSAQKDKVKDLLDQYRDVYPEFKYSFVDPDRNRAAALQNKVDSYPTVIIKTDKKEERISTPNEENVTNALLKLLKTDVKKVYFLKGHGEMSPTSTELDGFADAKNQIEKQNYATADLVLLETPEVPKDATTLVIAGPKTDPIDPELDSIRNYINAGGSLFVLLNPFKTPKLCALLKEFGIETTDDIIIDRMSRVFGGDLLIPVITTYVQFPITKDFELASFFPQSRSVKAAKQTEPNVKPMDLALTSEMSWTINQEQLTSGKADFDEKTGVKGPISVVVVSNITPKDPAKNPEDADDKAAKEASDETAQPKKARVVVTGSSLFASNKFMQALQANKELFLNIVSWLANDENLIAIRPKSSRAQPLILTGNEPMVIFVIPVVLIPLCWVILGCAVYFYRRRTSTAANNA
jgi:ABC-type uncharacterized transport system involved in gliding motility auxiliary subunit